MAITPLDEQLHEPTPEASWQESFYFNWAHPEGRYFGLTRIGYNPGRGRVDGVLITVRGGRLEYVYPGVGLKFDTGAPRPSAERGVRAGALSFTMREPLTRWHIGLTGKNEVDLDWTAITAPHDYYSDGPSTAGSVAQAQSAPSGEMHFEQAGIVAGRVRVGGNEYDVNGWGQRDKSWGVRDWAAVTGWDWITAFFGEDFGFNATLLPVGGQSVARGFVHHGGRNRALCEAHVSYEWTHTIHVPRTARLTLVDVDGQRYDVRAHALAQVPLYKKGLFVQETHAQFETLIDGVRRAGVGVLEHAWHAGPRGALTRLPQLLPVIARSAKGMLR